jgi:hypothetical protein
MRSAVAADSAAASAEGSGSFLLVFFFESTPWERARNSNTWRGYPKECGKHK